MTSVSHKMAVGIAWMSMMRFGVKGLGLISTVVLARLLAPADFGLVAMAMSVIVALELFSAFNFDLALIQRRDVDRTHFDTAWTFNVMFATAVALVLLLLSYPAADFYHEPRLAHVLHVLAASSFVLGFENIGVVAFRKDLDFGKEFALRMVQKVCATAITLPLAFILRNYWALIIGMLCGNVIAVAISYYAHPFRPRLSLKAANHLLSFSKWLLVNNLLWFLRDRTPDFILGRVAGADALGIYTISNEIANLPTAELVAPINRAVLPAYSKMVNDPAALRQGFLDVIGLIIVLALPAGFGIVATSELIVHVVLGDKWAAATPLVAILAVVGTLNALQTNCGNVHYAMGHPRTMTWVGGTQVALLLPTLIWGALEYGAIGVAYAYIASVALVSVPLNYAVVLHRLKLPFGRVFALLWRPVVATGVMYLLTSGWIASSRSISLIGLLVAIAIGALSYGATLLALWLVAGRPEGPERTLLDKMLVPLWARLSKLR